MATDELLKQALLHIRI